MADETASTKENPRIRWEELSNYHNYSPRSFAEQHKELEGLSALIESLGFSVKSSRLGSYERLLKSIKQKASYREKLSFSDAMQLIHTSVELNQLRKIFEAASATPSAEIWRRHLEHLLSGTHPSVIPKYSNSWDYQYEALVAAIVQLSGYKFKFAEPDIIVSLDDCLELGVAAKRPRNRNGFGRNLRKAGRQISNSGVPGIIAIDCTAMLATDRSINSNDDRNASKLVTAILHQFMDQAQSDIYEARVRGEAKGLFISLYMPITIVDADWHHAEKMVTGYRWTLIPFTGPEDPWHHRLLTFVERYQRGLFNGGDRDFAL